MMTKKQVVAVSGAIITSFVNLHFLEEVSRSGAFRQSAKNNVKKTLQDLIQIEEKMFSEIEAIDDENIGDKLVANKLQFVDWILNRFDFNDFSKIQEVCIAYSMDTARLTKVSDQILTENGSEVIKDADPSQIKMF
tara:strand:+ start:11 stop:418 length:408 start_codon:yes stop_codon:yes gene_type:complete